MLFRIPRFHFGPQYRTTLVKADDGKGQVLELTEPLSLIIQPDAKFRELQGNRITITSVTTVEKDPLMMGFKFEDDGPVDLQGERHDDDGNHVLLAPDDEGQQGDVVALDAVEEEQEIAGGRVEVHPQKDDKIEVNGEILTAESSLANLRSACRSYGISTSGCKAKVFKKLVEHQKGLQMQTVFHASTHAMEAGMRVPRAATLAEAPHEATETQHRLSHTPYQPWCAGCIAHRARSDMALRWKAIAH